MEQDAKANRNLSSVVPGAGKVMVFDRTCNDCRRTYVTSGIQKAVESIGDATARNTYLAQQAGKVHVFRQRVWIRNVDPSAYQ